MMIGDHEKELAAKDAEIADLQAKVRHWQEARDAASAGGDILKAENGRLRKALADIANLPKRYPNYPWWGTKETAQWPGHATANEAVLIASEAIRTSPDPKEGR